ncbi:hypothetical protein cand_004800 [Cryptosporidium andersoni]|uniref:Methyltransferase type 11 domain-containing protein n=1 Tax=Cryptosporidium andersoni TaxID=117008 RepID=A0A1J4MM45_9CRYT|nr:hypothetical protein cand_004800 [Cryptosporidium andersoni]
MVKRYKKSNVIINIKPSDKQCKPVKEIFPDIIDKSGDILSINYELLESKYVHDVYETMAEHFSHTRNIPWPKVKNFLASFSPGSIILDVGCGNGRYLECTTNLNIFSIGIDRCKSLIEIAKTKNSSSALFIDDCTQLNIRSHIFDGIICIAVIHHLSNSERRIQAVSELIRCAKKNGGKILIYVWSWNQVADTVGVRAVTSKDSLVPWHLQKKYSKLGNERYNDYVRNITIGQDNNEITHKSPTKPYKTYNLSNNKEHIIHVHPERYLIPLQRYYHFFEEYEIIDICNHGINLYHSQTEDKSIISIKQIYFDSNNWAIELEKF